MGIAEGMKNIADNIVDSHNSRGSQINRIVMNTKSILKDARGTLHDFSKERKVKASEQAEKLADFTNDLTKSVEGMVTDFKKNRMTMSNEQAKNLGIFMGRLEDDVEKLKNGVGVMLCDFRKNHKEMGEELRKKLIKEVSDIKVHVGGLLDEADELISGYRSDMKGAKKAWQDMSFVLNKSKKGGIAPKLEAKEKVVAVETITEKKYIENKIGKKAAKKKKK